MSWWITAKHSVVMKFICKRYPCKGDEFNIKLFTTSLEITEHEWKVFSTGTSINSIGVYLFIDVVKKIDAMTDHDEYSEGFHDHDWNYDNNGNDWKVTY